MKSIFGYLLLVICGLSVLAPLAAKADESGCRRSVVVYLDVSGSMYENRFKENSPWSRGRRVTLMENTVHFLGERLLAPGADLIHPGDRLTVRGFYESVSGLLGPWEPFDPAKLPAGIKEVARNLDFNHNKCFDINDARPKSSSRAARETPFIHNFKEPRTDFLKLADDMYEQFRFNPLQGPKAHSQLVFVILSDGGHDRPDNWPKLKQRLAEIGKDFAPFIARNQLKVYFFSLGASHLLHRDERPVVQEFKKSLDAKHYALSPCTMDVIGLSKQFAALRGGVVIQIPYRPVHDPKTGRLSAGLTVKNQACGAIRLAGVLCSLHRLEKASDRGETLMEGETLLRDKLVKRELVLSQGDSKKLDLDLQPVSEESEMPPGTYQLVFTVVTTQGEKSPPKETPTFPVAPPEKSYTGVLVALLMGLMLLVGGVIWFKNKLGGR